MFVKRVVGRNGRLRLRVPTVEALAGLVCTAGVLALTGSTASAQAQPRAALADEFGSGVRVALHEETGRVGFVGTEPGGPIGRPPGLSRTARPEAAARAFLSAHGGAFGLGPSATLRLVDERTAPGRRSSLRFQQLLDGVPVLGGELIVNLDDRRRILSASGETEPASAVDTTPMVPARDAAELARQVVARQYGAGAGDLEAGEPALSIYDARLLGGPGLDRPTLVWRVQVTGGDLGSIDELVLIDARRGVVALNFNQIAEARNRRVCDANNTTAQVPCNAPVRVEGGAASPVADVDLAYDYAGDTYDFFKNRFGRDSLDGTGMPMNSTVRYCGGVGAARSPTRSGTASRWSTARASRRPTTSSGTS